MASTQTSSAHPALMLALESLPAPACSAATSSHWERSVLPLGARDHFCLCGGRMDSLCCSQECWERAKFTLLALLSKVWGGQCKWDEEVMSGLKLLASFSFKKCHATNEWKHLLWGPVSLHANLFCVCLEIPIFCGAFLGRKGLLSGGPECHKQSASSASLLLTFWFSLFIYVFCPSFFPSLFPFFFLSPVDVSFMDSQWAAQHSPVCHVKTGKVS